MPSTVDDTLAYSVNKYDMAVGIGYLTASGNDSYDGLLWVNGVVPFYGLSAGVTDLNNLNSELGYTVIPSGWTVNTARSINDAGQIVGTATYGGNSYAYILSLPQALPGDANLDGRVDINDLTIVLANYGKLGLTWTQGSMDGDPNGAVDINDLTIVLANYGATAGASAAARFSAVPEPGSLLLAVAAVAGLLAFARPRRQR